MKSFRQLRNEESGIVFVLISAFAALMMIGIIWMTTTPFMENKVFDYAEDQLREDNNFDQWESTFNWITWFTANWPIVTILAVILFVFVATQRDRFRR